MKAKKKYYAVRNGRKPGIYTSWEKCQPQVIGCPGVVFKSFSTREEAEAFMKNVSSKKKPPTKGYVIYVDGSYDGATKRCGWGFAVYLDGKLVHTANGIGPSGAAATNHHNIGGEVQAATEAVLWASRESVAPITICHDYQGLASWALGEWQANVPLTQNYVDFMTPHRDWVKFYKVLGHSGVEGNELADKLARQALGLDD